MNLEGRFIMNLEIGVLVKYKVKSIDIICDHENDLSRTRNHDLLIFKLVCKSTAGLDCAVD